MVLTKKSPNRSKSTRDEAFSWLDQRKNCLMESASAALVAARAWPMKRLDLPIPYPAQTTPASKLG